MLSLNCLRLPALPKNNYVGCRLQLVKLRFRFAALRAWRNPNSPNTSQPWLLTVGGRWDLTHWSPSWDVANGPPACSRLDMPFSFIIPHHLHSNSWAQEDLRTGSRSDAKCPPRHSRHGSLSRGAGEGRQLQRWRQCTHPHSWEWWCHVAGPASEWAVMNRSH